MGKRKRTSPHQTKPPLSSPPSAMMPCSSRMDLVSKEKSLLSVDPSELKPLSSIMDITDSSMKLPNTHPSLSHHHYNLSRSIFLKRSRHYYGHQYFRRNSVNHASTSTSRGKGTPLRDERFSFKLASQCNSESGCHAENREKTFFRPERIRSSSLVMESVSPDVVKMVCGMCQKLLRRKPYSLGTTLSSSDHLSVAAVLVCGHVYHADCLEQQTCHEDRRDPPCPMCIGLLSKFDASRGQE